MARRCGSPGRRKSRPNLTIQPGSKRLAWAALSVLDVLSGEGYNSRLPLDGSAAEQYEDFLRR
jgi:hypothetical protein